MASTPPPSFPRRKTGSERPPRRVAGVDDIPTSPYGLSFAPSRPLVERLSRTSDRPAQGIFATAEAAPLLPLVEESSHVQPKSSLMPLSVSAPPASEPPTATASSLTVIWSRRWTIVGAGILAFTGALAVGLLTRPRPGSANVRLAATSAAPAEVRVSEAPTPVSAAAPAPIALSPEVAPPSEPPKAKRTRHTRVVRAPVKKTFTPSEI